MATASSRNSRVQTLGENKKLYNKSIDSYEFRLRTFMNYYLENLHEALGLRFDRLGENESHHNSKNKTNKNVSNKNFNTKKQLNNSQTCPKGILSSSYLLFLKNIQIVKKIYLKEHVRELFETLYESIQKYEKYKKHKMLILITQIYLLLHTLTVVYRTGLELILFLIILY